MNENKTFQAKFFDGHTIQATTAQITILPETVKITYQRKGISYELHWPPASLQIMERLYEGKPALIGSKAMLGARIVINNPEDYEAITRLIPKKNVKLSHVHHPWRKFWIFVAVMAIIIIVPVWKIHVISAWVANNIPYQWEELFWKKMVEPDFSQLTECVAPKGKQALNKLVNRLSIAGDLQHPLDVKVIDAPNTINAESLPGYHIFIYSGLFEINNPDAFASIMAHEMAHSVYHHVIAQYLSRGSMAAFFENVLGLSSNNFAYDFLNLKFTRDYEIEADRYSLETLKKANINTSGFSFAMKYLQDLGGDFKGVEPYLVDHPTYQERIDLVKEYSVTSELAPALSKDEWNALKSICSEKQPIKFSTSQ